MRRNRETLEDFTGRALRATGTMIPPRVFVPLGLRKSKLRIVGHRMTVNAPDAKEDAARIAEADPTAFLIAVMQGQPIPAFKLLEKDDGSVDVSVVFDVPSMEVRATVALALSRRVKRPNEQDADYEARMKNAAAQAEEV